VDVLQNRKEIIQELGISNNEVKTALQAKLANVLQEIQDCGYRVKRIDNRSSPLGNTSNLLISWNFLGME
jgi:hypothetical protein